MKSIKVYLNIYDFTPANNYLNHLGIGAYHTGVEIKYFIFLLFLAINNIVLQ
jgi:hypothetical protein